jgi:hypothetical protein
VERIEGCDGRDYRFPVIAMTGVEDESVVVDVPEAAGQQHTDQQGGEGGEGGEGEEEEGEEARQDDVVVANIEEAGDTWEAGKDIRGVPRSVLEVSLCLSSSPPPSLLSLPLFSNPTRKQTSRVVRRSEWTRSAHDADKSRADADDGQGKISLITVLLMSTDSDQIRNHRWTSLGACSRSSCAKVSSRILKTPSSPIWISRPLSSTTVC